MAAGCMRCCALICPWKVDLQTSDHDKNSTSTDAHVSRRDGINNNNNWEVNDYMSSNPVIRFLTPIISGYLAELPMIQIMF